MTCNLYPDIAEVEATIVGVLSRMSDEIQEYLLPLIQSEFDRVREATPGLTAIRFRAGTFTFEGEGIDWVYANVPDHAKRLYELCRFASSLYFTLGDFYEGDIVSPMLEGRGDHHG